MQEHRPQPLAGSRTTHGCRPCTLQCDAHDCAVTAGHRLQRHCAHQPSSWIQPYTDTSPASPRAVQVCAQSRVVLLVQEAPGSACDCGQ